jgi:bifunctional non-homologous end joining protein LigD
VRVYSRRGNDHTDRVPAIAEALATLPVKSVTLDGEGVVCGPGGVTDFARLRAALGRKGSRQAFLHAFDVLELDGEDLRGKRWDYRREMLTRLLRGIGHGIQLSEHVDVLDGPTLFKHGCAMGLEGIVAKRRDRPYRSGRSPDWVKVKNPNAPAATRLIEG